MEDIRTPETSKPQRRVGIRWNYKRIAVALAVVIFAVSLIGYGTYSLAKLIFAGSGHKSVAEKPVKVAAAVYAAPSSTTTTTEPKYIKYTVEEGDSYYVIALKYATTIEEIKKLNRVSAGNNDLKIGMVLKVPVKELSPEEAAKAKAEDEVAAAAGKPAMKASAKELFKGPADKKRVALTFDAGEASEATPRILTTLKDANVKGTFFLTGKWIEENPELTKKIASEGHIIGNHSYSHIDFTKQTDNEIVYQLSKTEALLTGLTKTSMKPIFRPPFGARDGRVLRVAAKAGYTSIYWTVDSLDWKHGIKPEQVKNRTVAGLANGVIVLMHCGSGQTADMLPGLIKDIESRGYELVTVPELFE